MMDKPTVPEVRPLVKALFASEHGSVGGCLHIVLDDGNVQDHDVQFCLDYAKEQGCQQCMELAAILLKMSRTQRLKLGVGVYRR